MCSAKPHVRFTPESDRESGFSQTVKSALPPIADMCGATAHACFGPKADIRSARPYVRALHVHAARTLIQRDLEENRGNKKMRSFGNESKGNRVCLSETLSDYQGR